MGEPEKAWMCPELTHPFRVVKEQKVRLSGSLPLHNEEKYLPYTLKSLQHAPLFELVFVLDRCTDHSEAIIDRFAKTVKYPVRKHFVEERRFSKPTAEVMRLAYELCQGDIVYSLGADCHYHSGIFNVDWSNLDFACFPYYAYNLFGDTLKSLAVARNNVWKHIRLAVHRLNFSGIFAFRKSFLPKIEFKDVVSEDVDYLKQLVGMGCRYKFFSDFVSLHLRPLNAEKMKTYGASRFEEGYSLVKMAYTSALMLNLDEFQGYMERRAEESEKMKLLLQSLRRSGHIP